MAMISLVGGDEQHDHGALELEEMNNTIMELFSIRRSTTTSWSSLVEGDEQHDHGALY